MNTWSILFHMLKADYLERTRRRSFLVTLCLVIYLGYAVNTGQILIKLGEHRGIYNSAWVGSLMALVITFFLGITGFYLVKDTIQRDERTGVGQIIATTPLTRAQYLLGKWLSNFALLTTLVGVLAAAAILMQLINHEAAQIEIGALIAPLVFIALPMMALVAALAVFFETVSWLKGGFGNMVYFFVFIFIAMAGIELARMPWLDVMGLSVVGSSMKASAAAAFPDYKGGFVLSMASDMPVDTFVWPGLAWTPGLIAQRMLWLVISAGVALSGSLFFNRFDPSTRGLSRRERRLQAAQGALPSDETVPDAAITPPLHLVERGLGGEASDTPASLTPLPRDGRFHLNFFRLVWLECLLLVKGLRWYWLAGMAVLWIGCIAAPSEDYRKYWFMLAAIWPALVWSKLGEREAHYQAEHLIYQAAYPLLRVLASSWVAGVLMTAAALSGVLLGRLFSAEPVALATWLLSVLFIPTLALALGVWSRTGKTFEVVYPILWYLGPFNGLADLDYLGIYPQSPVVTSALPFAAVVLLLIALAFIGRRRQIMA